MREQDVILNILRQWAPGAAATDVMPCNEGDCSECFDAYPTLWKACARYRFDKTMFIRHVSNVLTEEELLEVLM